MPNFNGSVTEYVWTFQPDDFFDTPPHLDDDCYTIRSVPGRITARIDMDIPRSQEHSKEAVHRLVLNHFYANQLVSNKPYTLSFQSHRVVHPDGKVSAFIEATTGTISITGRAHLTAIGPNGEIIDPTADRIRQMADRIRRITTQLCQHSNDQHLQRMIWSHHSSVGDPQNALVHLFEICDALTVRFGKETSALSYLKFSKQRWGQLGRLANNEPILEGRHRGKHTSLRRASNDELAIARTIALELIEAYLNYLDSLSRAP